MVLMEDDGGKEGSCRSGGFSLLTFDFQAGYPSDPSKDFANK
jgi:hypothetical protein